MKFPKRIYTAEEVKKAAEMVKKSHKHNLQIDGSQFFLSRLKQVLRLVRTAGYYDFLRTYIRSIIEIDGVTQLREADATIWVNQYALQNLVDAASLLIQKTNRMKEYLESEVYNSGVAEKHSVEKRIEFLRALKKNSEKQEIREECEKLIGSWTETTFL